MPIDTSIQFNGHNSYRVTETVFCDPFGVEGIAYVTHSFNAYATSALGAATRARTRFFKADGSIAGTTDHSFTVAAIFTEVDITVAVPADSVLCQMSFLTSGTWWVAEPKSEEGQTATPYNTNYQGQLSMLTPDGAYLGMLTTAQIVVAGTLAAPTESLNTRLVTINNNAINLSSTVSGQGTEITNIQAGQITLAEVDTAHGNRLTRIEAGVIIVSGSASYAAGYDPTSKETPAGAQARVDWLANQLGDLALDDLVMTAMTRETIIVGGHLKTSLIDVETLIAQMVLTNSLVAARIMTVAGSNNYGEVGNLSGRGIGLDLIAHGVAFASICALANGSFAFYDGAAEHQRIAVQTDSSFQFWTNAESLSLWLMPEGSARIANDCSALSFTDRTIGYKGDALTELASVTTDKDGMIDHTTLPELARKKVKGLKNKTDVGGNPIKDKDGIITTEKFEEDGRDLGAMISILTVAAQQLTEITKKQQVEIDKLTKKL